MRCYKTTSCLSLLFSSFNAIKIYPRSEKEKQKPPGTYKVIFLIIDFDNILAKGDIGFTTPLTMTSRFL